MGAFDHLIPKQAAGGAFDHLIPGEPTAGGVQDFEPIAGRHIGTMELPNDRAAGWATTRIRNAVTGLAGAPRAVSDVVGYGARRAGVPEWMARALQFANPITLAGQFSPSTAELNAAVEPVLPSVNTGGKVGKVVDTAVEAALGGAALGGPAAVVPSLVGGATSEAGGQATAGTAWEPAVRVLGGLLGGGVAAFGQNAMGSIWQGLRNLKPNVDETSAKILARAAERDKTTPEAIVARQTELGPGATFAEAGGPNVRGTVRGAIAAPGEARTNVANAFDDRIKQVNDQTTAALDRNISGNRSLASTVDEFDTLRSQASTPAYQAAGIPRRPESRITAMDESPTWNTRTVESPALDDLFKNSRFVRQAMGSLRQFTDYKNVPTNTMAMWDAAYKRLGGMERAAVRGGDDRLAMLIGDERRKLLDALSDVNPDYVRALKAYSGPSQLIDASTRGKDWFSKNTDPAVVRKEFAGMSPDEQQAALIGVRDWARDVAGRSDRGIVAERVWSSDNNRQRFQAILETPGFESLGRTMETSKNAVRTVRDIGVGSRTTPMAAEAADNAGQINALTSLAQGRPVSAAVQFGNNLLGRVAEGRTEAVNARLAEIAMMTDPKQVGMVAAAANRARLQEMMRGQGRRNALLYGPGTPMINALTEETGGGR